MSKNNPQLSQSQLSQSQNGTPQQVGQKRILSVKNLKKFYPIKGGLFLKTVGNVFAVNGISFDVYQGETLGIVGESGCGKSTLARQVIRLEVPTEGEIWFEGQDLAKAGPHALRPIRRNLQVVFQDPFASLNPRMSVEQILIEGLNVHKIGTPAERTARVEALLERVGLRSSHRNRYPHEFSGGQRQRISIARALTLNPKLIVLDEPVSALDVSVQAQILNLMMDLQDEFGLSYVFIAHDLAVVERMCDRVMVLYLGKCAEIASAADLFSKPVHPYTQALIRSIPNPDPRRHSDPTILHGDVPSPIRPPSGCHFHTRCPHAQDLCKAKEPALESIPGLDGRMVACHFKEKFL
jgi:oligopeptide transport system ATP-binding protein